MPLRAAPLAVLAGSSVVLAACGDSAPAARCTPAPKATPATVTAGSLTARTDAGVIPAGGTLKLSLDAAGPLSYTAPCEQPVQLIVIDSSDLHVDALGPPAPKGTPCGPVSLAAGQTAHYEVLWTADDTLPPGRYTLAATLGDQPALSLQVSVGAGPITCGG